RYSPQNAGHFGLAMKSYTHFTSPIRRYPDLIVHRVLREVIERGKDDERGIDLGTKHAAKRVSWPVLDEQREIDLRAALEVIGDHSSERERAADDAERELMNWRKADFMSDRVGEDFDGVITSVKDYGLYVELDEFFVEGLVHISTLVDDHYEFHERKHRLVGKRTRREFRLGDRIRVAVNRVDRARHLIDFSVA
ncbi:MAG TPA: RNB domain-containing ribonuclease, partial [Blastocatellia bacterium]|nr:RNB domain-containing ribonuclease [Blastocatellia bacterium]